MSQIAGNGARLWRVFAAGTAAGFIGVMVFAGGRASADPAFPVPPAPTPAPAQAAAPPVQNVPASPGGANRFAPTPTPPLVLTPAPAPAGAPFPPSAAAPAAVPAMPPTVSPAISGTLREYLQGKGVKLEAQRPQGFKALDITLPVPPRWTQVPDPNVPDAFAVIADRVGGSSVYTSNAQVVVYKLVGNFDPAEAITHGYVDSQRLMGWQTTNASMNNLGAFPSSVIEGTYRENDMTLNTSRRNVIASSGADKYLVTMSVTTAASQAISDAPATDAIINGFRVVAPGAPAPAPTTTALGPAHTAVSQGLPAQAAAPAQAPASVPAQMPAPLPAPAQAPAPVPAPAQVPAPAPVPAQAPATVPAPLPATVPAGVPAPVPATVPAGVPAPVQAPASGPAPSLLNLVPGLPPLPNLHLFHR